MMTGSHKSVTGRKNLLESWQMIPGLTVITDRGYFSLTINNKKKILKAEKK